MGNYSVINLITVITVITLITLITVMTVITVITLITVITPLHTPVMAVICNDVYVFYKKNTPSNSMLDRVLTQF